MDLADAKKALSKALKDKSLPKIKEILTENPEVILGTDTSNNQYLLKFIKANEGIAKYGIDVFIKNGGDVNQRDSWNQTVLMQALSSGKNRIVQLLLDEGADVNVIGSNNNLSTLQWALNGKNRTDLVKMLFKTNPNLDVTHSDSRGDTALHLALAQSNFEVAKILLDKGADPDVTNRKGEKVWYYGSKEKNKKFLEDYISRKKLGSFGKFLDL